MVLDLFGTFFYVTTLKMTSQCCNQMIQCWRVGSLLIMLYFITWLYTMKSISLILITVILITPLWGRQFMHHSSCYLWVCTVITFQCVELNLIFTFFKISSCWENSEWWHDVISISLMLTNEFDWIWICVVNCIVIQLYHGIYDQSCCRWCFYCQYLTGFVLFSVPELADNHFLCMCVISLVVLGIVENEHVNQTVGNGKLKPTFQYVYSPVLR